MSADSLANILFSTLRVMTPLLLAALAGLLSQRVNLLNIGLEGLMVFGAFFAVVFGSQFGNPWLGVLFSLLCTLLVTAVYSFAVIELQANLIVAGLAINTLAVGLSSYLLVTLFNVHGAYSPVGLSSLPHIQIPFLESIPFVGAVFSRQGVLVYLSWAFALLTSLLLYRTPLGIHIRAIGEHPEAAQTAGIRVKLVQYVALMVGGGLCALAGAQLSLGDLTLFNKNMVNGRGFIALAAVFFGAAKPGLTALGCFLFGLFEVIQYRLQTTTQIPPQLPQMLPYVIVVLTLTVMALRKRLVSRRLTQ